MSIDAHVHIEAADTKGMMSRAQCAGVERWVVIGSPMPYWEQTLEFAKQHNFASVIGIHPWDAAVLDMPACELQLAYLSSLWPDGLGEMGLDGLHPHLDRQEAVFRAQLQLARERSVPVMLHAVKEIPKLLAICKADGLLPAGIIHGWSGSPDLAKEAVKLGFYLSFGTLLLRENARRCRESIVTIPLSRLLLESDGPGAPDKRREPAIIEKLAREVAILRNEPFEKIWAAAGDNAREIFPVLRK